MKHLLIPLWKEAIHSFTQAFTQHRLWERGQNGVLAFLRPQPHYSVAGWAWAKFLQLSIPQFLVVVVYSVMSDSATPWTNSLPGSSVHGIFQARILQWVAMSYYTGASWPRDWTCVSCCLLHWQEDSILLSYLGSPYLSFLICKTRIAILPAFWCYCNWAI